MNLTGLNRMDFEVLCQYALQTMRNTPTRYILTSVGIFLLKMKSGLSNKIMASLLNISKSSLHIATSSVLNALMTSFVTKYLGLNNIWHSFCLVDRRAIFIVDGTYLYTEKRRLSLPEADLQHAQRSSSCKDYGDMPTSGYLLSILGPYFANSKKNDAAILNHAIAKNVDTIRQWVKE